MHADIGCKFRHGPLPDGNEAFCRLAQFAGMLPPKSVAIIVSSPEMLRNNDIEYRYRQSSDMLYLNGFPEPQSVLVVSNFKGKVKLTMLVRPKDPAQERWTGIREGVQGAVEHYHADRAYAIDKFEKVAGRFLKKARHVYYRLGRNEEFDRRFLSIWKGKKKNLLDPEKVIHEMRLFKSSKELELMRQASGISAEAHREVMGACRPGMFEYELQAVAECVFTSHGAAAPAYGTIMAGGPRATVLHYDANSKQIEDGQLVLNDSACEYRGYASDITRTFPACGRFSKPQREIYELVLKAQMAAIDAARPGVRLGKLHKIATQVLEKGLIELGVLPCPGKDAGKDHKKDRKKDHKEDHKPEKSGDAAGALSIGDVFMHGTSHWVGLDVHDVGSYGTADGTRSDKGKGKQRRLEPGMVFTVEPGLYFDAGDKRVSEQYRGIGVRIEDVVVITAGGCEVITSAVPKTVAEIEGLMQGR